MQSLIIFLCVICGGALVGCASDKKENPYKEAHIVDIIPNYQIAPDNYPTLKKPIDEMTEEELKARYGELQKQSGLSAPQQTEFNMIAERLRQFSKR